MIQRVTQRASLIGRAIEDITYRPLDPGRYTAELRGFRPFPQYKPGGFFVFSNVPPGDYTLRLTGSRLRLRDCPVKLPLDLPPATPPAVPILDVPGEDELIAIVRSLNGGSNKLFFDPIILPVALPAGAEVLSENEATVLALPLGPGKVSEARVQDASGFTAGTVVRIRRGIAIRMRFDPYYAFSTPVTVITGKVTAQLAPTIPLPGARVKVTEVNGVTVTPAQVHGIEVSTVNLGGRAVVLGTDVDIATGTDGAGYYSLYFSRADFISSITLAVTLDGFGPQARSEPVTSGRRKEMNFQLSKA